MENKLALQALPLTEVMSMAETFSKSGMFTDAKDQAQAFVKIIAGQEIGIPPFAAISGIHIVKGKPTIGAGLIASCIKGSGKYDYKVKQLDDKVCSIEFFQSKESLGISTFTIEDARKAQTQNLEKFPRNMLFARAISNGVKWFCPDVFSGPVYTPEEMNATTEDAEYTIIPPVTPAAQIETAPEQPEVLTTDYESELRACGNTEELKATYKKMPKDKQVEFKDLVAEMKESFIKSEQAA